MVKQGIFGGSAGIPGRGGQAKSGPAGVPGRGFIEGRHLLFGPPLPCPGNLTRAGTAAAEEGADSDDGAWSTGPPGNPLLWLGITGVGWNHSAVADFVQRNISLASNRCQRKKAGAFGVLNEPLDNRPAFHRQAHHEPAPGNNRKTLDKPLQWGSGGAVSRFRRFRFLPAPFSPTFPSPTEIQTPINPSVRNSHPRPPGTVTQKSLMG